MSKNEKKYLPCLNAGLSLLNLGLLMASNKAKALGVPLRTLWLDSRSHVNLKDLCGATIMALYASDPVVCWHSLTERCLEKRFGRIRSFFPNSCPAAADYWRASAMVMRREVRTADGRFMEPQAREDHQRLLRNSTKVVAGRSPLSSHEQRILDGPVAK